MRKNIILSSVISLILTSIGTIINLITYFLWEKPYLSIALYGGEWTGYRGFGILMNKTYPIYSSEYPLSGHIWLEIDPMSFVIPFVLFFIGIFVVLEIRRKMNRL